jgi:integrase
VHVILGSLCVVSSLQEHANFGILEWSRNHNDPIYPLWVLILVLGLRKGEALGLIWPDGDWPPGDEDSAVIDLEWQLQRVGGHPLTAQAPAQGRRQHRHATAPADRHYGIANR